MAWHRMLPSQLRWVLRSLFLANIAFVHLRERERERWFIFIYISPSSSFLCIFWTAENSICSLFFRLLQLLYLEAEEPRSTHNSLPIRSSITPTKKVDVDRTIMPDGTIVTTVTTVQSRLKLERSPGPKQRNDNYIVQIRKGNTSSVVVCAG